jgi:hypothetical protein
MRRSLLSLLLALGLALPALAEGGGLELGLFGGWGFSRASARSVFSSEGSALALESLRANTTIRAEASSRYALGASLAWFFTPALGVELSVLSFDPGVATTSDFAFDWKLSGQPAVSESRSRPGPGRLSSTALGLSFVARRDLGPVRLSLSAGPAIFFDAFNASGHAGLGASYVVVWYVFIDQLVDSFQIPIRVEETSWTAFGGSAALTAEAKLAGPLSLALSARYSLSPSKELAWTWQSGTYTGTDNPNGYFSDWEFGDADLAPYQAATTPLKVNPSFFAVTAGLRVRF